MKTNVIIAIVAVVAVAAVGGGAFMLIGGGGSPSSPTQDNLDAFQGLVYGNANGDCYIDSADITLMNKIISGEESFSNYPLADANRDGTVNDSDISIVNSYIAGTDTELWVRDTVGNTVQVTYPVNGIFVAGGTNMRSLLQVVDLEEKIVALGTNEYIDDVLDSKIVGLINGGTVKTVTTGAKDGDFSELGKLDFSLALVEDSGINGYHDSAAKDIWKAWGVDVLVLKDDNFKTLPQSIATIAILVGTSDKAEMYINYLNGIVDKIKTDLGDKYQTATVLDIVMSRSVNGKSSDYYEATRLAGGNNIADWDYINRDFDPKADQWLFDEKYNPDYLIHIKSMKYGSAPSATEISQYKSYFDKTKAYQNGNYYLFNGVLPYPVRLALMATIMYSDVFDSDWPMNEFQIYLDTYGDYNAGKTSTDPGYWNVDTMKVLWDVDDLNSLVL